MVTCQSPDHYPKYFHFCCYCKKERPDHLPCTSCGYAKTDRVTRARHLNDKNKEAKANPIAIDDDEDDEEEGGKPNKRAKTSLS
jgi:hypothetical protein